MSSAHNVTPQMGQGCNSALEDAVLLDKALSSSNYDIRSGLQHFQQQRKPQVSMIRDRRSPQISHMFLPGIMLSYALVVVAAAAMPDNIVL